MLCDRSEAGNPAPLVIPIFPVSCVSGMGLAPLHAFLAHLNLPSPSPAHAPAADMLRPASCAGPAAAPSPPLPPQRISLSNGDQEHGLAQRLNGAGLTGALQNPAELPTTAEPCQVIFQVHHGSWSSVLLRCFPALCSLLWILPAWLPSPVAQVVHAAMLRLLALWMRLRVSSADVTDRHRVRLLLTAATVPCIRSLLIHFAVLQGFQSNASAHKCKSSLSCLC